MVAVVSPSPNWPFHYHADADTNEAGIHRLVHQGHQPFLGASMCHLAAKRGQATHRKQAYSSRNEGLMLRRRSRSPSCQRRHRRCARTAQVTVLARESGGC